MDSINKDSPILKDLDNQRKGKVKVLLFLLIGGLLLVASFISILSQKSLPLVMIALAAFSCPMSIFYSFLNNGLHSVYREKISQHFLSEVFILVPPSHEQWRPVLESQDFIALQSFAFGKVASDSIQSILQFRSKEMEWALLNFRLKNSKYSTELFLGKGEYEGEVDSLEVSGEKVGSQKANVKDYVLALGFLLIAAFLVYLNRKHFVDLWSDGTDFTPLIVIVALVMAMAVAIRFHGVWKRREQIEISSGKDQGLKFTAKGEGNPENFRLVLESILQNPLLSGAFIKVQDKVLYCGLKFSSSWPKGRFWTSSLSEKALEELRWEINALVSATKTIEETNVFKAP